MYTYGQLNRDLAELASLGAKSGIIGRSESGRKIPYVKIGRGGKKIIVTGGIHARENLTSRLVVMEARYALWAKPDAEIYFVPMVNPDGVVLVENGADAFGARKNELIRLNGGSSDFSLWKANAFGVDLNVNFDARFGLGASNVFAPASENYVGEFPFCAAETRALREFTLLISPDATVSYHAKGQELYWFFHQSGDKAERDKAIAIKLNEKPGYRLGAGFTDSAGGYKDWCVEKLGIPAFTLEIISDGFSHPLNDGALTEEEISKNIDLPIRLAEFLK